MLDAELETHLYKVTILGDALYVRATTIHKARTQAAQRVWNALPEERRTATSRHHLWLLASARRVNSPLPIPKQDLVCKRCGTLFQPKRKYASAAYAANPQIRYCEKCRRTILGKSNARKGDTPYTSRGYTFIPTSHGYRAEHKVVMEKKLGRKLRPKEAVHHIDGNRSNNDPNNLELWVRTHPSGVRAQDLFCPHCGKSYFDK